MSKASGAIRGRLGQGHADVLESMCFFAHKWRETADGRIELLVDKYKVRKASAGGSGGSGEQLDVIIDDLLDVSVELVIQRGKGSALVIKGHLIDEVAQSQVLIEKSGRFGTGEQRDGARAFMRVTFGRAIVAFLRDDLRVYYDPTSIAKMAHGVSQALARHILTHENQPNGGWILNKLLVAIGAGENSQTLANRRRELKRDALALSALGISIEEGRVYYEQRRKSPRGSAM
jgi:hypothetical protein